MLCLVMVKLFTKSKTPIYMNVKINTTGNHASWRIWFCSWVFICFERTVNFLLRIKILLPYNWSHNLHTIFCQYVRYVTNINFLYQCNLLDINLRTKSINTNHEKNETQSYYILNTDKYIPLEPNNEIAIKGITKQKRDWITSSDKQSKFLLLLTFQILYSF